MSLNIRVCGVGGQGVITAGLLISDASIASGHNVVMSEIHGLAQRGGSVFVDIRIGDGKGSMIPEMGADMIIALESMESIRNISKLARNGLCIVGSEKIPPVSLGIRRQDYPDVKKMLSSDRNVRACFIESVSLAESCGDYRASNVVLLGAAMASRIFPFEMKDMLAAISRRFSGNAYIINRTALEKGYSAFNEISSELRWDAC